VQYQAVDVCVEWAVRWYVLELLPTRGLREASCIGHYLTDLPTCGVGIRQEVGQVARRYTSTSRRSTAWVSIDEPTMHQAVDVYVECRAHRHVLELLPTGQVIEAGRVRDYLG